MSCYPILQGIRGLPTDLRSQPVMLFWSHGCWEEDLEGYEIVSTYVLRYNLIGTFYYVL